MVMSCDELEALRLADLQGFAQAVAAREMGVSRPTFGRIVADARSKVARALVQGRGLRIEDDSAAVEAAPGGGVMRFAIAVDGAGQVSAHFGRSERFRIYETTGDGGSKAVEDRVNEHAAEAGKQHGQGGGGGCGCGHGHGHGHGGGGAHGWIQAALGDCELVVARGMGPGAVAGLRRVGVRPVLLDRALLPDEAAHLVSEGRL